MASTYRTQLNDWLRRQSFKADQVLDVGGSDGSVRKMTNLECNRYMVLDSNADAKPQYVHDINEFIHGDELFGSQQNPRFDLIFCLNVFEYVHQPYNAMANLYTWLGEGGTLVVNFPFLYPIHNPVGIDYLRYTHEWVNKMFHQRFQFESVETFPMYIQDSNAMMNLWSSERMHYRKDGTESWREMGTIVKATK